MKSKVFSLACAIMAFFSSSYFYSASDSNFIISVNLLTMLGSAYLIVRSLDVLLGFHK